MKIQLSSALRAVVLGVSSGEEWIIGGPSSGAHIPQVKNITTAKTSRPIPPGTTRHTIITRGKERSSKQLMAPEANMFQRFLPFIYNSSVEFVVLNGKKSFGIRGHSDNKVRISWQVRYKGLS